MQYLKVVYIVVAVSEGCFYVVTVSKGCVYVVAVSEGCFYVVAVSEGCFYVVAVAKDCFYVVAVSKDCFYVVAVSKGKNELDGEDWSRVKEMESERRNTRLPPPRSVLDTDMWCASRCFVFGSFFCLLFVSGSNFGIVDEKWLILKLFI